jgi:hypothetical protein
VICRLTQGNGGVRLTADINRYNIFVGAKKRWQQLLFIVQGLLPLRSFVPMSPPSIVPFVASYSFNYSQAIAFFPSDS